MGKLFSAVKGDVQEYFGRWSGWILFTALILYYEMLFHGMNFDITDGNIWVILAFSLVAGGVCGLITGIFIPVVNKIIATVLTLFIGILFIAQYVYHSVFNNYLSLVGTLKLEIRLLTMRILCWAISSRSCLTLSCWLSLFLSQSYVSGYSFHLSAEDGG